MIEEEEEEEEEERRRTHDSSVNSRDASGAISFAPLGYNAPATRP